MVHKNTNIDNSGEAVHSRRKEEFKIIYLNFFAPLCVFAKKFVNGQEEDLVNTVFINIWEKNIQFESQEHCRNYLYKSVRNTCIDFIRSQQTTLQRNYTYVTESDIDFYQSIEEIIIETEYWAEIYREILSLPKASSSIVKMSYFEGLNNQEIANKLNLSIQTVKNQKSKGIKLLRSALTKFLLLLLFFFFL